MRTKKPDRKEEKYHPFDGGSSKGTMPKADYKVPKARHKDDFPEASGYGSDIDDKSLDRGYISEEGARFGRTEEDEHNMLDCFFLLGGGR